MRNPSGNVCSDLTDIMFEKIFGNANYLLTDSVYYCNLAQLNNNHFKFSIVLKYVLFIRELH